MKLSITLHIALLLTTGINASYDKCDPGKCVNDYASFKKALSGKSPVEINLCQKATIDFPLATPGLTTSPSQEKDGRFDLKITCCGKANDCTIDAHYVVITNAKCNPVITIGNPDTSAEIRALKLTLDGITLKNANVFFEYKGQKAGSVSSVTLKDTVVDTTVAVPFYACAQATTPNTIGACVFHTS